jgi:hypothetical protein
LSRTARRLQSVRQQSGYAESNARPITRGTFSLERETRDGWRCLDQPSIDGAAIFAKAVVGVRSAGHRTLTGIRSAHMADRNASQKHACIILLTADGLDTSKTMGRTAYPVNSPPSICLRNRGALHREGFFKLAQKSQLHSACMIG